MLAMAFSTIGIIFYLRKKIKLSFKENYSEKEMRTSHKILNFAQESVEMD